MYCEKCNKNSPDESSFCQYCGKPFNVQPPYAPYVDKTAAGFSSQSDFLQQQPIQQNNVQLPLRGYCRKCGCPIYVNELFCAACGTPFEYKGKRQNKEKTDYVSLSNWIISILCAVSAIIFIIAGICGLAASAKPDIALYSPLLALLGFMSIAFGIMAAVLCVIYAFKILKTLK